MRQYFDIKIDYVDISPAEFKQKMQNYLDELENIFTESSKLAKFGKINKRTFTRIKVKVCIIILFIC